MLCAYSYQFTLSILTNSHIVLNICTFYVIIRLNNMLGFNSVNNHMCVCVRMRACVRACVRAYVRTYIYIYIYIYDHLDYLENLLCRL